ncbi:hypothetical protein DRP43_03120 [candidate division TA06 bacterium]|uniref:Fibronectin type-III domain-containing protein n=1 Tax=candidate division TA06 bacterium TaxID=2250710 RepID=A0A660SIU8_UNCT6|nr:MAG: hypothetical protein DRP43_03120 [candidate division TA06 bacterium]
MLNKAKEMNLPLYLRLPGSIVVEGKHSDMDLLNIKGYKTKYISDISGYKFYIVSSMEKCNIEDARKVGEVILYENDIFLVRSMEEIDVLRVSSRERLKITPLKLKPLSYRNIKEGKSRDVHYDPEIAAIISQVDTNSIRGYLEDFQGFDTRFMLALNRFAIADSIRQYFLNMGITDVVLDTFYTSYTDPNGDSMQVNVVATIPGTKDTTDVYIVGGHWDSIVWPYDPIAYTLAPGVDDNGTGATATLEMARILASNPPDKTVIFIAFASEELGEYGSKHYATNASASGMNIGCMFNFDMIGNNYENTNIFYILKYPGSEMYMNLFAASSEIYTGLIPVIYQELCQGSDGWAFYQQGYCVTFALEYIYGNFHTVNDSLTYVSVPYVSDIIRAGLATLLACVNYPAQVENIHIQDQGDGSRLAVDWSANSEVDIIGYYVYWGLNSGNYQDSNFVSTLTDTISGLLEDSTYYITVRAIDDDGHLSIISNEFTGVPSIEPSIPKGFSAIPINHGIKLIWEDNTEPDFDGYRLYKRLNSEPGYDSLNIIPFADTVYIDSPLIGSNKYYYTIRAIDTDGNVSDMSEEVYSRPITLDQGILIIDETNNWTTGNYPTDSMQDVFYGYMLSNYNFDEFEYGTAEEKPLLADFVTYSTVIWVADDYTTVFASQHIDDFKTYLDLGGNMLFAGWKLISNLLYSNTYPYDFDDTSFIYNYLKISHAGLSGFIDKLAGEIGQNSYPDVSVDTLKIPIVTWGNTLRNIESITPVSGVESIYTIDMENNTSPFEGEICGIRYLGSDYNMVYLGFPLYFMEESDIKILIDSVMNDFGEEQGIKDIFNKKLLPKETGLLNAIPNPLSSKTRIVFKLKEKSKVSIDIFNISGQLVKQLINDTYESGVYKVSWDRKDIRGRSVPEGIYFYRLSTDKTSISKKIIVID